MWMYGGAKVIIFFSGLTYNLFLAQLILWTLCNKMINDLEQLKFTNKALILYAFCIAFFISIFEKYVFRILDYRGGKKC